MALSRWTQTRLKIVAVVTLIGAGIGVLLSWLLSNIMPFTYDFAEFENGARNGAMIAGVLAAADLFYVQAPRGAWIRRLSFGRTVLARAGLFTALIVVVLAFNRLVFGALYGFERSGLDYFELPLLRDTILAFIFFLIISEFLQMRRVIGGRTLNNLLLGSYHKPVREQRVFLLVDIKGSTALAERLGDEQAHAFITSVFFDIDQPILEHDGEIYSYVGDGLIASWPVAAGIENARCLECYMAIRQTLAQRAEYYRDRFGIAAEVRVVLHTGPIVAGECGDAKLSIVYLGDTLNTAARLEEIAKQLDRSCLISDELLRNLRLPSALVA
ncbi:MAG: adenylate/guanylate cyclase domain-containing protein, partial [Pseudomonadota bacterium]